MPPNKSYLPITTDQRFELVKNSETKSGYGYVIFIPDERQGDEKTYPLLLFLHGAGESGNLEEPQGVLQLGAAGTPAVILSDPPKGGDHNKNPRNNGTLVADDSAAFSEKFEKNALNVAPEVECCERTYWLLRREFVVVAPRTNRGWRRRDLEKFTSVFLEERGEELRIDRQRLLLTGLSMGGGGCWVGAESGLFAACVPVCAAGTPANADTFPKHCAIWAWHAINDSVVPVSYTDEAIRALQKADHPDVQYSRSQFAPGPCGYSQMVGHAEWIRAYREHRLYEWLLQKRLP